MTCKFIAYTVLNLLDESKGFNKEFWQRTCEHAWPKNLTQVIRYWTISTNIVYGTFPCTKVAIVLPGAVSNSCFFLSSLTFFLFSNYRDELMESIRMFCTIWVLFGKKIVSVDFVLDWSFVRVRMLWRITVIRYRSCIYVIYAIHWRGFVSVKLWLFLFMAHVFGCFFQELEN